MGHRVIMWDMDGVLADFTLKFSEAANELFGTPVRATLDQKTWSWKEELGNKDLDKVWEIVRNTPGWWLRLPSLVHTYTFIRISNLSRVYPTYFVTSRVSDVDNLQKDTGLWLRDRWVYYPNVIVVSSKTEKGNIAKAIGATHSIEDNLENAKDICEKSPWTKSYIINRLYNQDESFVQDFTRGFRVDSVEKFLDEVEKDSAARLE